MLACDYELGNLYEPIHRTLLKQNGVHADETSYRVLKSEKVATYFCVFASGRAEDEQIVLYEHADSRTTKVPKNFLNGHTHFLQTDGYQVYDKLDQVKRVACLSHIRRKFFEAMGKQGTTLRVAKKAVTYCDRMFKMAQPWRLLIPDQRYQKRQGQLKSTMFDFCTWCESVHALPQSKFGRAIDYALSQREVIENMLLDGRLELSNRVERAVKELVIGRKSGYSPRVSKEPDQAGLSRVSCVRPKPTVSTAANISNTYLLNYPSFSFLAILKRCRIIYHGVRKSEHSFKINSNKGKRLRHFLNHKGIQSRFKYASQV
ncbi:Transposase [Lacticaseibacillus paracasei subsp. paracasei Lpp230]|nr:Transposase [Lacticaseibacillus paracasei subsp. paracasei Lpp230]